jgi:hypothetical protein
MESAEATLNKIKEASKRRILFLPHAIRQMSRPDRMIGTLEWEKDFKTRKRK